MHTLQSIKTRSQGPSGVPLGLITRAVVSHNTILMSKGQRSRSPASSHAVLVQRDQKQSYSTVPSHCVNVLVPRTENYWYQ